MDDIFGPLARAGVITQTCYHCHADIIDGGQEYTVKGEARSLNIILCALCSQRVKNQINLTRKPDANL